MIWPSLATTLLQCSLLFQPLHRAWGRFEVTGENTAEVERIADADGVGDFFHAQGRFAQQRAGAVEAGFEQPLSGRATGVPLEDGAEVRGRKSQACGEFGGFKRLGEVAAHVPQELIEFVLRRRSFGRRWGVAVPGPLRDERGEQL